MPIRKNNRKTSSSTRQARIKGNAGGSQPRPRPTQVSTMKQQGPIKPKAPATSSETRNPNRVRAGINQNNKPGAGRVTGTMGRPKPSTPARVTASNRAQSPRLPNLPKNPVTGTTKTIRATGGGSRDPKINRLSAQAAKPMPRKPAGPKLMPGGLLRLPLRLCPFVRLLLLVLPTKPSRHGLLLMERLLITKSLRLPL
jgi:hypothetical protein